MLPYGQCCNVYVDGNWNTPLSAAELDAPLKVLRLLRMSQVLRVIRVTPRLETVIPMDYGIMMVGPMHTASDWSSAHLLRHQKALGISCMALAWAASVTPF